ncbi:Crp/Fnr family transcriptional regulator [Sphingomonas sp. Root241]|uniref:Crp/Fnr family transcriptional regulator n=1 Tax=Sphingomonas sp. Root241 TaxID=1736501 RepID=UPI0009E8F21F|nr:Crp/Fnr family transcriptional regulator [Sphingomonas sp. Root241]
MSLSAFIERIFDCSAEAAHQIESRARLRFYSTGATIVHQGERCQDVYLLVLGRARSFVVAPDGMLVRFYDFLPGDLFGALSASDGQIHLSEISALENLDSAVFSGTDFLILLETHACVGLALSRGLLRQLERISEQMLSRTTLSAAGRVHEELLRLAEGGTTISPPPVLSELAARIYTTRETASRTISALERRGIVRRDAEALVIVAPGRLAEMVI